MRRITLTLVILPLATTVQASESVRAAGGYEANALPGDAGWTEAAEGFLGDFVTVNRGVMTYDGSHRPAPATCGMKPPVEPVLEGDHTLEYRV